MQHVVGSEIYSMLHKQWHLLAMPEQLLQLPDNEMLESYHHQVLDHLQNIIVILTNPDDNFH